MIRMATPELPKEMPHRVVDGVFDSLLAIPENISEAISSALDKGPLGKVGLHRMINSVVKGIPSAVETLGEGFADALDQPTQMIKK